MSKQPDYVAYTLEQLERARRTIDVARYPDRATLLDDMIRERRQRHTVPLPAPEPIWPSVSEVFWDFFPQTQKDPSEYKNAVQAKRGIKSLLLVTLIWAIYPVTLIVTGPTLSRVFGILFLTFLLWLLVLRWQSLKQLILQEQLSKPADEAQVPGKQGTSLKKARTPAQALLLLFLTILPGIGYLLWLRSNGLVISEAHLPFAVLAGLVTLLLATHWILEYLTLKTAHKKK